MRATGQKSLFPELPGDSSHKEGVNIHHPGKEPVLVSLCFWEFPVDGTADAPNAGAENRLHEYSEWDGIDDT